MDKGDVMNKVKNGLVEYSNGNKCRYLNRKLHRIDGPAVELADGVKHWVMNGVLHREDGPAIEYHLACPDGVRKWSFNGEWHRIDGPAIEYANGRKEWWINGKKISEEEFNNRKLD
jgi:hypothetical protein